MSSYYHIIYIDFSRPY